MSERVASELLERTVGCGEVTEELALPASAEVILTGWVHRTPRPRTA